MKDKIKKINRGFTLVEMLVVIAIVGILAAILVPVIARAKTKAKIATAKFQMSEITMAIKSYKNDYERYPIPKGAMANGWGDITFGTGTSETFGVVKSLNYLTGPNSKVMEILMDPNHVRNPKKNKYMDVKESGEPAANKFPGLSNEKRYLDPFGNDYMITMDKNRDGLCFDALHAPFPYSHQRGPALGLKRKSFSNGKAGNPDNNSNDFFAYQGEVMIWTAGPDKKVEPNVADTAEPPRETHPEKLPNGNLHPLAGISKYTPGIVPNNLDDFLIRHTLYRPGKSWADIIDINKDGGIGWDDLGKQLNVIKDIDGDGTFNLDDFNINNDNIISWK